MFSSRRFVWAAGLGLAVIGMPACKKKEAPPRRQNRRRRLRRPLRRSSRCSPLTSGRDRGRQAGHDSDDDVRPPRHDLRLRRHRRRRTQQEHRGQVDLPERKSGQGTVRGHRSDRAGGHRVSHLEAERLAGREVQGRDYRRRHLGRQQGFRGQVVAGYWILKTDADTYPFDQLVRERRAVWDGVSNALALKHIRSMKKGDHAFIYHSGDEKALVGLAKHRVGPLSRSQGRRPQARRGRHRSRRPAPAARLARVGQGRPRVRRSGPGQDVACSASFPCPRRSGSGCSRWGESVLRAFRDLGLSHPERSEGA